ncbi:universal stress protein [Streptomyces luomodiensis]|uniref:Universal stress protein n=1 Tax=Streptomyces luomodiensis TaxID=3026192 RepID=A0ABY9UY95_9ACTN|nr:universal stress protein [Streptomyces sp. SCA4-21]WNE97551.1 universal stress protein [Streptomyces sp. SCA4-21]
MSGPVVAGVDGSRRSLTAAEWAAREAARRGAALRLVHACPPLPRRVSPVPGVDAWQHVGEQMLGQTVADFRVRHPALELGGEHTAAEPAEALLTAAASAGLLVVGARGWGGFDGLAVGSVALRVAAMADCPVVTVPEARRRGAGWDGADRDEVQLGFDAHAPAEATADFAFRAAWERGVPLRVVHAWALPPASPSAWMLTVLEEDRARWEDQESQVVSDALRPWRERYPEVTAVPDVILLNPAEALVRASERAGLLVLGRRTATRPTELRLGPVAHAVLHHAHCPVAVVPHPAH